MTASETYDVVVVGSGAAGGAAALRAAEHGLSVIILEKAHKFGGTSATSGGVLWVPNHHISENDDTREQTFEYLNAIIRDDVQQDKLSAYVDQAPQMVRFLKEAGVPIEQSAWPDYFPDAPGARVDRSLIAPTYDGRKLGDKFLLMREQFTRFKVFNRYSMDVTEFFYMSMRYKGWVKAAAKMIMRYWLDFSTRGFTRRDRRFTMGAALIGWTYDKIFARGVEVRLETRLEELVVTGGKVTGVKVNSFGRSYEINARHGVVISAGGFEWNQELRDRFFKVPGLTRHSSTPEDANRGEGLIAGLKIGAATEWTESGWWIPTMQVPMPNVSNFEEIHQAAFDVGRPHSVCVNRNGHRFVDETCGYDRFGDAMVQDQLKTGANTPCWLIFDAQFRKKYSAGGVMPTLLTPDRKIPPEWWDHYIFKADSLDALAAKVHLPADVLKQTVATMNEYARTGKDLEFNRGENVYDQTFGDMRVAPNPCLGPIAEAPFYAVPINLGDLGTKGGLKTDAHARVLDGNDQPIANLYAAGNAAGNPFGNCYPGAGATIGPAMVFGYIAANHIAERTANQRDAA